MRIDPSKIKLLYYPNQIPTKSLEEQAQQEYENQYARLFNRALTLYLKQNQLTLAKFVSQPSFLRAHIMHKLHLEIMDSLTDIISEIQARIPQWQRKSSL